jgi:hypothetical protein
MSDERRRVGAPELPTVPAGAHLHVCPCGNHLVCYSAPDQCPLSPVTPWFCPSCERAALDAYFSRAAREARPPGGYPREGSMATTKTPKHLR